VTFSTFDQRRRLHVEALESRLLLDGEGLVVGEPAPAFVLEDTNPTSATFGQTVSTEDYLGKVSGWYFGSAL